MDGHRDSHTEWNVRYRKTNVIWYCLYVESKKRLQMNLSTIDKLWNRVTDVEKKLMVTGG